MATKVKIQFKKKENEAIKKVRLDPTPLVRKVKPTPRLPEEYVLDREKVLALIELLDNQGRQFEQTPKTYRSFEEEEFRDVILVNLNSLLGGRVTGETFSKSGKTDIYLNIDKGNILVCECKIRNGPKAYLEAIDQLLDYLTWRHNYGIIIAFVRQKNFSKILETAKQAIPSHTSFKQSFKVISDTHFESQHKLNQDESKNVEIHHLFYNIFTE